MRFRDILVWVFVFIVGSLIVSFLIYPQTFESFKSNIKGITGNVVGNVEEIKEDLADKICPENIIPEKITLHEAEGTAGNPESLYYFWAIYNTNWEDETEIKRYEGETIDFFRAIDDSFGIKCRKGSEEGENTNYFYCDNLLYSPSKTKVNSEGVIESSEKSNYKINLVLEPIENEEWYIRKTIDKNRVDIYGNYSVIGSFCLKVD